MRTCFVDLQSLSDQRLTGRNAYAADLRIVIVTAITCGESSGDARMLLFLSVEPLLLCPTRHIVNHTLSYQTKTGACLQFVLRLHGFRERQVGRLENLLCDKDCNSVIKEMKLSLILNVIDPKACPAQQFRFWGSLYHTGFSSCSDSLQHPNPEGRHANPKT